MKYRVGTFSTFRQAMLDAITRNPVANPNPGNPGQTLTLTSRSSDDYGVAMLEMWAYVCDVLAFYQQSIANEAFLGTATQQASIARLAALLGYRPSPAVAASVSLAFLTNRGAAAAVAAALQTQSVPGPGEQPVIFEVADPISASAVNNQPVLLGPQTGPALLGQSGWLLPPEDPANPVVRGNRLLFFDSAAGFVSEQQVTSVTPEPVGKLVAWRGNLGGRDPRKLAAYRLGRTFRAFGANAPQTYVTAATSNGSTTLIPQTTTFGLAQGVPVTSILWLDAVYSGLGVGSPVLVQHVDAQGNVHLVSGTIAQVVNSAINVGPISGSSTGIKLESKALPDESDLRGITVYELLGPALTFAATGFDSSYPAGVQSINVVDATGIAAGFELAIVSGNAQGTFGDVVSVSKAPVPIQQKNITLGYTVSFSPQLGNAYDLSATTLYANVTDATALR